MKNLVAVVKKHKAEYIANLLEDNAKPVVESQKVPEK